MADPAAAIAFLTTTAEEVARDDAFWRERAAGAAMGETAAQFVAIDDDEWIGTVTVLVREDGLDHRGRELDGMRADVVGVYLAPAHRGVGVLNLMFAAARTWARAQQAGALMLSVHADNLRAQAAYRRAGFVPTGVTFTSAIGPELEMRDSDRPVG